MLVFFLVFFLDKKTSREDSPLPAYGGTFRLFGKVPLGRVLLKYPQVSNGRGLQRPLVLGANRVVLREPYRGPLLGLIGGALARDYVAGMRAHGGQSAPCS